MRRPRPRSPFRLSARCYNNSIPDFKIIQGDKNRPQGGDNVDPVTLEPITQDIHRMGLIFIPLFQCLFVCIVV
jgi:hypothetical protein